MLLCGSPQGLQEARTGQLAVQGESFACGPLCSRSATTTARPWPRVETDVNYGFVLFTVTCTACYFSKSVIMCLCHPGRTL